MADRLAAWLNTPDGSGNPRRRVQGVNALGTITVTEQDLPAKQRMPTFRERLAERRDQLSSNPNALTVRVPLLTAQQLSAARRVFVVRAPGDVPTKPAVGRGPARPRVLRRARLAERAAIDGRPLAAARSSTSCAASAS